MITLYGYWRSSAAYRVRIALNLKNIEHQHKSVHLVKEGGQQHSAAYVALNPTHLVPTLVDGAFSLNQSLAIIDYLDDKYSDYPLYPNNLEHKALVKALSFDIACEIHPVNNLRVQQYIVRELDASLEQKTAWLDYWLSTGFKALETRLETTAGDFCFGDKVSVADLCLIPQVYNAVRFNIDMSAYKNINRIVINCNQLPAFIAALPENQDDANL